MEPLRRALVAQLDDRRIEDLPVPFQCCAARIEDAAEHWFDRGPVVDAVLASAAVPGLLPAVRIGEYHYLDGGLVDSIPLGRAVELGAQRVFVLQVGRIEQALTPPRNPWEVGVVAFEIARRHRFARDMATAPDDVEVHVLPAGDGAAPRWNSRAALRYRDFSAVDRRIDSAYRAAAAYLEKVVHAPDDAETAAAPVDAPDGARPGDDRRDRDAAAHASRCGCSSRLRRRHSSRDGSGRCACCGS